MPRPRVHDDDLRQELLAQAGRTVAVGGLSALSLRTLAADAGTSTSAVYSLFGGRAGLLGALLQDSFASFGAAQRAVAVTGDALVDLEALGQAYWRWARRHPDLYGVLFSAALADAPRTAEQQAAAESTIEPLADAVRTGVTAGVLAGDPKTITFAIWAAVHGVVSLVQARCAPEDEPAAAALFDATAAAAVRGWTVRSGAVPVRTPTASS